MIEVSEGYHFRYLFESVGLMILGICLSIYVSYTGVFFILLACLLLLLKSGTLINTESLAIARFESLLGIKKYKWYNLKNINKVTLNSTVASQTMHGRVASTTHRVQQHSMTLLSDSEEQTLFYTYSNYKIAVRVLMELNKNLNIKVEDNYLEAQKRAYRKRQMRKK